MSFTKFFLHFMFLSVLLEKTFKIHCLEKQQTASVLALLDLSSFHTLIVDAMLNLN